MGWGICLTKELYVSRVMKDNVADKIEENKNLIELYKNELYALAIANPRDVVSDEARTDGSVIFEINRMVREAVEGLEEVLYEQRLLEMVLEDIDKAEDC